MNAEHYRTMTKDAKHRQKENEIEKARILDVDEIITRTMKYVENSANKGKCYANILGSHHLGFIPPLSYRNSQLANSIGEKYDEVNEILTARGFNLSKEMRYSRGTDGVSAINIRW